MTIPIIKCVVAGDKIEDQTSLIISYTSQAFPNCPYKPVVLDNFSTCVYSNDTCVNLQLNDLCNDIKLRKLSYPQTQVFILTFSLVDPRSLQNIEDIWVPEIKEYCPDVPFILVGLQSSYRDEFAQHESEFREKGWEPIPSKKGEEMKQKIGAKDYIESDPRKQYHINEVFDSAIDKVLHPHSDEEQKDKKEKSKFHLFKKQKDKK